MQRVLALLAAGGAVVGRAVVVRFVDAVAADVLAGEDGAGLGVDDVEGGAGDRAAAVGLLLDRVRQEARTRAARRTDPSGPTIWPTAGSDQVWPTLFSTALALASRSPYGASRRVELGQRRKRPVQRDPARVREVGEHLIERRRRVRLAAAERRRHVRQRDVERVIVGAARPLADDQRRMPLVVVLDVRDLRRAVDEVRKRPDRLAVEQGAQLRQQVQRDEAPHLHAEARVDGLEDAAIRAHPDDRPPLLVVGAERRVVRVGRRIERRRVHDRRRRARPPRRAAARGRR